MKTIEEITEVVMSSTAMKIAKIDAYRTFMTTRLAQLQTLLPDVAKALKAQRLELRGVNYAYMTGKDEAVCENSHLRVELAVTTTRTYRTEEKAHLAAISAAKAVQSAVPILAGCEINPYSLQTEDEAADHLDGKPVSVTIWI